MQHYLCTAMDTLQLEKNRKQVATWLLIGVAMIIVQVIIGGITRLTESGLSITEWKPITGALPPMNITEWQEEFDKYRTTDQFKYVHQHFSLSDFKFIYFWEWFHRQWARLIGVVFLIGFVYFLVRKKFDRKMVLPLVILFLLGALQGAIGWIMVQSGLVPEKFYVGHIELGMHFIAALILLCFTLWYAMGMLPAFTPKLQAPSLKNRLLLMMAVLFLQLLYGGFMAGLKAAPVAPTWPTINGEWIPAGISELSPRISNIFQNKLTIQFIHRGLAYLLFILSILFFMRSVVYTYHTVFKKLRLALLTIIIFQVLLGILTVLNATDPARLLWFGVLHQFVAILLVMCMTALLFVVRRKSLATSL